MPPNISAIFSQGGTSEGGRAGRQVRRRRWTAASSKVGAPHIFPTAAVGRAARAARVPPNILGIFGHGRTSGGGRAGRRRAQYSDTPVHPPKYFEGAGTSDDGGVVESRRAAYIPNGGGRAGGARHAWAGGGGTVWARRDAEMPAVTGSDGMTCRAVTPSPSSKGTCLKALVVV
ncbi:hypothetical protein GGX14DRAFT_399798 [Mycena pura]|uniref:Uncharacterized protein n=1 Tax=Mycena pura TaxID=153505 RepID=A0AAD6V7M1_9AGAR|nr:hypothetical protein GGX14DRAFT_399798 [Mycena pura]